MSITAKDCPNCYTDNDDETDCPHLLEGDDCPNCGNELTKPPAGKVECDRCFHVVNGQSQHVDLRDFELTYRQADRLLYTFGYGRAASPGNAENALRRLCSDFEVDRKRLNDLLADLKGEGRYASSTGGDDER